MTEQPTTQQTWQAPTRSTPSTAAGEGASSTVPRIVGRRPVREADSLELVAAQLGFDARPVEPSRALRASVLAAIASTPSSRDATARRYHHRSRDGCRRSRSSARSGRRDRTGTPDSAARAADVGTGRPDHQAATARPAGQRAAQGRSALVLAARGFAVGCGRSGRRAARRQHRHERTQQRQRTRTQTVQLAHINAQPDAQRETIKLTNINDEQRVVATLVWSGELGKSALIVDGLAPAVRREVYELWYIGEEGPVSAGTFNTSRSAAHLAGPRRRHERGRQGRRDRRTLRAAPSSRPPTRSWSSTRRSRRGARHIARKQEILSDLLLDGLPRPGPGLRMPRIYPKRPET